MENIEICQSISNELKDLIIKEDLVINKDFLTQIYNNTFNDVKNKVLIRKYNTINSELHLIKFGETIFDNVEILMLENSKLYSGLECSVSINYRIYEGFYKFDYIKNYELYKNHVETTEEVWKTYYDKYLKIKEVFEKELQ